MKTRSKIILIAVIVAPILAFVVFAVCRYRANVALGRELRIEIADWLESIPEIPEEDNGAPVINKGIGFFADLPRRYWVEGVTLDSEKNIKDFRDYIAEKEEAFNILAKGLDYSKWAFITDYEKGIKATLPDALLFKKAAIVYSLRGELAIIEGRNSDALKDCLLLLRLGNTLARDRAVIPRMIQVHTHSLGLKLIFKLDSKSNMSEEQMLLLLKKLLDMHGSQGDVTAIYDKEYYDFIMTIASFCDIRSPLHFIYDFRQDTEPFRKWLEIYRTGNPNNYYKLRPELKDIKLLTAEIGLPESGSWKGIFAQMGVPNLNETFGRLAEIETMFRGMVILSAIRLFESKNGALPENLKQLGELVPKELLIDPFSGNSLIYRVEGADFYLYSVGYNGKDDNGKDKPVYGDGVYPEEVSDIVFHAPPRKENK